jgi:hypothetical protein
MFGVILKSGFSFSLKMKSLFIESTEIMITLSTADWAWTGDM